MKAGLLKWASHANPLTVKALSLVPSYRTYREMYALLQRSQRWSREELAAYQMQALSRLLDHAYENVPYYRRVFRDRGLVPGDVRTLGDLELLPFLTKEIVQANLPDLKARNYPESAFEYVRTSGSTGIPMGFYYEQGVSRAREWAFMKTQWDRVGYRFTDRCVVLRGHVVDAASSGIYWKQALFGRWLIMSSHQMTEEALPAYIDRIRRFRPRFIQGYPSTAVILARYMREHDIEPFPTVKAVLCGSENLYPWQRNLLAETFGCRVFSWYGNSEQTVLAGECEESTRYHIFPEYGIVELIGRDGRPVEGPGAAGEVVATNLTNFVCPLIRYRTMDVAISAEGPCTCGRAYPLLEKVEGRLQEFIVTRGGHLISVTPINYESGAFENIRQFQMYQEEVGELIIKVVRKPTYTEEDTRQLTRELQWQLGDEVNVHVRFVDEIPRTRGGKFRYLIQELPISIGDL
ncbi:AMP-binding protein [Methanoculleus sp.]|uniref:phenylacetate--CoA ligase family protein n=1 Tax=Methanoculleus sp. TaxID=90427 RepID=UPI0025E65DA2|nr:AMP-binding protein [Methanoculleus sp.]MCK9316763.1 AMP-binding protein [Methanoculleus sp.]MDD2252776.1 AMP-binding protein [Methanoculleus sp.]MDD2788672.1 AMP-binding protein [Methanoculleus sp.]MDD3215241.1 AMP-binding protein [Methanoculleus sp.]MDD4313019.1 AMP-binding protein [Methanoculleus sp.]